MAELDRRPDANARAASGIGKGFWAGLLGVLVIAIAAAFFMASRNDMSSGPETTGSASEQSVGQKKTPDPAATTPNTPERRK